MKCFNEYLQICWIGGHYGGQKTFHFLRHEHLQSIELQEDQNGTTSDVMGVTEFSLCVFKIAPGNLEIDSWDN